MFTDVHSGLETAPAREGATLFLPHGGSLPPFCVKCAKPVNDYLHLTLRDIPSRYHLLLLFLHIFVWHEVVIAVPVCREHIWWRRALYFGATGFASAAVPAGYLISRLPYEWALSVGIVMGAMLLFAAALVASSAEVLRLKCITEFESIFTGAGEDFMALLPARNAY